MIAKNIKGKSFKGCVSYVMNDTATILEAEGIWADNTKNIIRSFAIQRSGRKEIKQPVGHIPISFSPEDKDRMTNEFMVQLAKEYMLEMGIKNTQYVIVRHDNTENPHLHIVYNRINNDLKLISVNHDYKRNIKVCKKLKDKYNLTYGKGKEKVKREKLDNQDKVKYKIHDAIKAVLPYCKTPNELKSILNQVGIETEFKLKRTTGEIEGISFQYGDIAFKGSQIDRKFSYRNLKKEFIKTQQTQENSIQEEQKQKTNQAQRQAIEKPKAESVPTIGGIRLTKEQFKTLKDGGYIYLENMQKKDGTKLSAYVFFDDKMTKPLFTKQQPESFTKYGKYEMRLMDKMRIEAGFVTHAKVKWYGGGYAYPYLWKVNKADNEYKEAWGNPRVEKDSKLKNKPKLSAISKINKGRKM
ncbi:MAG: relaxase/mobilization nuclease domain-containing protein [Dysgonomonas sp.]|nr:relaxase/mobilization nuclease domain-containing protein [Dysgonomonas sp.]